MKIKLITIVAFAIVSLFLNALFAADTVTMPGAAKVWGSGGVWNNYAEVVSKVEAGDVSITAPVDDATYRLSKKMSGQMTGPELLAYADSKKAAWAATGSSGTGAYYNLLRFAARNETDPAFVNAVINQCKAALATPAEAAAAANSLYWIYADAQRCGDALLYWQKHYQPRSLYNLVDLGTRNGTVTPERGYTIIRDYFYGVPKALDGAMACKLYDQAMRLTVEAKIPTDDLKAAVKNIYQLYASVGTGDADWTIFRQKIEDQLKAFKNAE